MAAPTAFLFNNWRKAAQSGANLAASPTLKATLHTSSYTPSVASQAVYADLSNELATANGYTVGGASLSSVTFAMSGANAVLAASPTVWNCTVANIVARYLALRYVGTVNGQVDPLILYVLMDSLPADVVTTPGNSLTVTWNASGIVITS